MVASLMFLFAGLVQNAGASRYHPFPHPIEMQTAKGLAPQSVHAFLPYGPVRSARTQMQMDPESGALTDNRGIGSRFSDRWRNARSGGVWRPDLEENWRAGKPGKQEYNLSKQLPKPLQPFSSPRVANGIDMRKLLQTWGGSLWESGAHQLSYKRAFLDSDWKGMNRSDKQDLQKAYEWALQEGYGANWTKPGLAENWRDTLFVLQKMEGDLTSLQGHISRHSNVSAGYHRTKQSNTNTLPSLAPSIYQPALKLRPQSTFGPSGILVSVGLIPNIPSANDTSVEALAVFSRSQLKDNSKFPLPSWLVWETKAGLLPGRSLNKGLSPLLKMVEEQFGTTATRGMLGRTKRSVPVFAIEGLAEAPNKFSAKSGLSSASAKKLLVKIAEWAQHEQRLVVVARHAVHFSDGTDLTEYYMHLGFQKVEMNDGSYDLVYPGTSSSDVEAPIMPAPNSDPDQWPEYEESMVYVNPWSPWYPDQAISALDW